MLYTEGLVDGLLENAKYLLLTSGVTALVFVVIALAWWSTGLPPLSYYVWLVQLHSLPERRIIQVFTMHDRTRSSSSSSHAESESSDEEVQHNEQPNQQTSVVIIQTPSAVTSTDSAPAPLPESSSDNGTERHYTIDLPADGNEDINEIHRILRANTDNAIATAATIALYNRRFTENNPSANPLLVSRVSVNVESEESPPPHNILISYDTLQAINEDSGTGGSPVEGSSGANEAGDAQSPHISQLPSENEHSSAEQSESGSDGQSPEAPPVSEIPPAEDKTALTIKLKFLDDTQRMARAWLTTTVGEFKKNYFSDVLTNGKVVRLIFQGQLLRDDARSLESYGIHDQCVVHCHVGTRPYAQPNSSSTGGVQSNAGPANDPSQPNSGFAAGGALGARIIATGIGWIDLLLYATWTLMVQGFTWIQSPADVSDNLQMPTTQRAIFAVKRALRVLLSTLVDVNAAQQNAAADDPFSNRFNAGFVLGLLFAMKFIMLWMFVFYFPQYTDPRGIFLLTVLTAVTASYFFFNRATPQRARQY